MNKPSREEAIAAMEVVKAWCQFAWKTEEWCGICPLQNCGENPRYWEINEDDNS